MYFRSSSQTKSPVGSSSGDRNGDGGRQNVGGPKQDNQTVSFRPKQKKRKHTEKPKTKTKPNQSNAKRINDNGNGNVKCIKYAIEKKEPSNQFEEAGSIA